MDALHRYYKKHIRPAVSEIFSYTKTYNHPITTKLIGFLILGKFLIVLYLDLSFGMVLDYFLSLPTPSNKESQRC